jgi:spermidine synthase
MRVLHDAAGDLCWITVQEDQGVRYLLLDGCEEGAMYLNSADPVFNYLWFHKCSMVAQQSPRRALVLGAGAFTAAKCLALDYPAAGVDAVDEEPQLERIARQYFFLDQPAFARIQFFGQAAEPFLAEPHAPYDLIFDDLFDGFQHVPWTGRSVEHVRRLNQALAGGGVCLKNVIWNPLNADTRAACTDVIAAWRTTFPKYGLIALGDPAGGHNLMLLGSASQRLDWPAVRARLSAAGVPEALLEQCHWTAGHDRGNESPEAGRR